MPAGLRQQVGGFQHRRRRLISARNDRVSLILGKVGVMKILAFSTMLVLLVAAFVFYGAQAVIFSVPSAST